mgnify:CR=1 FL=1
MLAILLPVGVGVTLGVVLGKYDVGSPLGPTVAPSSIGGTPTLKPTATPTPISYYFDQLGSDLVGFSADDRFGKWVSLSADGRRTAVSADNAHLVQFYEVGDTDSCSGIHVKCFRKSSWRLCYCVFRGKSYTACFVTLLRSS